MTKTQRTSDFFIFSFFFKHDLIFFRALNTFSGQGTFSPSELIPSELPLKVYSVTVFIYAVIKIYAVHIYIYNYNSVTKSAF